MPLPEPQGQEREDEFMARCMRDPVMNFDFPDSDQRMAVCSTQWERNKGKDSDE